METDKQKKFETLEQRIHTLGPGTFGTLIPNFEEVHLISQLQSARMKDIKLRNHWFYPGNGAVYGISNDDVIFYMTDFANNPLMKNPSLAILELTNTYNFSVDSATSRNLKAKAALEDGVTAINLSKLPLQGDEKEWRYVEVGTDKLMKYKEKFREYYGEEVARLFDAVHGDAIYGADGIGSLLLKDERAITRIYVLNPSYVKNVLKEKETMIARSSRLLDFNICSNAGFVVRDLAIRWRVRGVINESKVAEEQNAQKILPYDAALEKLKGIVFPDLYRQLQNTLKEIYQIR